MSAHSAIWKPSAVFAADVLTTAVEGGCSYWADIRRVIRAADRPVIRADFRDSEDQMSEFFTVDAGQVAQGIARLAIPGFKINPALRTSILKAVAQDDAGGVDAEAADVIVQAAIYNELMFG